MGFARDLDGWPPHPEAGGGDSAGWAKARHRGHPSRAALLAKGAFDRTVAVLLIALLGPLLLAIAAAVVLETPGPAMFRQRRHGLRGREFNIFKFRTMAWCDDGAEQTTRADRRVTGIGRFLRRSSLDELPQLFNVLNGTMALVGPRPHPVAMRTENRLCCDLLADYRDRHRVKPGMTGWAQIHGHRGAVTTRLELRARLDHDLAYIHRWSLLLDAEILLLTPVALLFKRTNAF